ncbi:MAG: aminotransferase class I/II-fold pyridoxal phosphate-dependent enzyme, partial [Muribaculaceae bacterium]|nr:aminotransferase class I/II-fold pyridoxal phosphate-dependent enzyme [Muribaculaceae bacterium]
ASPSKTFNIAGLQIANIFAPSAEDRRMIERAINDNEICDVNPFGVTALITAYNRCADWLDELKEVIQTNYRHACAMFDSVPGSGRYFELQGTYLMWVDMRHLAEAAGNESLEEYIKERSKVWVNDGAMYGPGGEGFIRINLACPPAVFARGLDAFFTALAPLISASL